MFLGSRNRTRESRGGRSPCLGGASIAAVLLLAGCSNAAVPSTELGPSVTNVATPGSATPSASAANAPQPITGGCGSTPLYAPPGPSANRIRGIGDLVWVAASPASAGLYAYPWGPPPHLVAGASQPGTNKVLWISDLELSGTLRISAHPLGSGTPIVNLSFSATPDRDGNYPSEITLPTAGCWELDLTLGSTTARIDLLVASL